MISDLGAMHLAIAEARKGLGFVAPNPPVGCVIVSSDGRLLAKGYHEKFGGDHAEISALKKIKNPNDLSGATLFVTLEPCAHQGQTPSCATHISTLPLRRVVYGLEDPNPLVSGKGHKILESTNVKVEKFQFLQVELEELAEIFLWNHRNKSVFVAVKVGTSLDGQMALQTGESQWITGEHSRLKAHELRAHYDCVLVGKNTVLRDNPSLDIRHPRYLNTKNKVVVLDSKGEIQLLLPKLKMSKSHGLDDIIIAKSNSERVEVSKLLSELYQMGIRSVLVEGGAEVLSSFITQKLAQRFYQFIAPRIIGASGGITFSKNVTISHLNQSVGLVNVKSEMLGQDIFISGRFKSA